ncbi:MAG TPA: FixH family protein [Burkholderiales bacterium]|nr:FixH family protein [Burkholderiales bacterium]
MTSRTINQASAHWYLEPWPWILLALPASAVVAGIITLVIAVKNEDPLVVEDYYKQGLAINRVIERETRAAQMGLTAQMLVAGDKLRINLDGSGMFPERIVMQFVHPTRAGQDREVSLLPIASGWYQGSLPDLAEGRWRIRIEDGDGDATWRLTGVWMTNQKSLTIAAPTGS